MKNNILNGFCIIGILLLMQGFVFPAGAADHSGGTLLTKDNYIDDNGENFGYHFFNNVQWIYKLKKGDHFESIAISGNGQYVVAAGYSSPDTETNTKYSRKIWVFNRNGDMIWDYSGGLTAAISSDGKYIAVSDGTLFSQDGKVLWKNRVSGYSIAFSADDQYIAFGGYDTRFLVNREGRILWESRVEEYYASEKIGVITADGQYVIVDDSRNNVSLIDKNNKVIWNYFDPDENLFSHVVISADGQYIVAVTEYWDSLRVFNRDGRLLKKIPLYNQDIGATIEGLAISPDGRIISAWDGTGNIIVLSREGELLYNYHTPLHLWHSANWHTDSYIQPVLNLVALSSDGNTYAVIDDSLLFMCRNDNHRIIPETSPPITPTELSPTSTIRAPITSSVQSPKPTTIKTPVFAATQTPIPPPVAAFIATPISGGPAPLTVKFTDQSTGSGITSRVWQFKPYSGIWTFLNRWTTFTPDPTTKSFAFDNTGSYDIKLTVKGTEGSDEEIKNRYVNIGCDFSKRDGIEVCFGGIGSNCEGDAPGAPFKKNEDTCQVEGHVSMGSILHDSCCLSTDNGGRNCDGLWTGDDRCSVEWQEAWDNTLCSIFGAPRQWNYTFGPYPLENKGDKQELRAPTGTRISPIYERYCQSEKCKTDENGETIRKSDSFFCSEYCICE